MNCSRPSFPEFAISHRLLKLMFIESVMPSKHLVLWGPLLLIHSVFPRWLFTSGGQSIGASTLASVLLKNIQDWLPLGLTGLRVPKTPWSFRDSQQSAPTPHFKSINSLTFTLLYGPTLTSIHYYWKSHSFDNTNLYQPSDVSAF